MAWSETRTSFWLLLPAAGTLAWAVMGRKHRPLLSAAALVALLATLLGFTHHLRSLSPRDPGTDPDPLLAGGDSVSLARRFEDLFTAGPLTVDRTLAVLADPSSDDLQTQLSRIRRGSGITALAAYDAQGRPRSWVGVHRGPVPQEIRRGDVSYAFGGGPLFRYLYFTGTDPRRGWTVVAAALLQTNFPGGLEEAGLAARFQRSTGIPIRILPPDRASGPVVWNVNLDDVSLLSVVPEELDAEETWARDRGRWVRGLALLAFLAWGLTLLGGKGLTGWGWGAGTTLLGLSFFFPDHGFWPGGVLSSPDHFLLPLLGWSLGKYLVFLAGGVFLCGLLQGPSLREVPPWVRGGLVALGFPLADLLLRESATSLLFSSGVGEWILFQGALSLTLTLVAWGALGAAGEEGGKLGGRSLLMAAVASVALAFGAGILARSGPGLSPWALAAWGGPAYLLARGGWATGRGAPLRGGLAVALLASSAALPAAWGWGIMGRMAAVEAELMELGAEPDGGLEARLLEMAVAADSLDGRVPSSVEYLFETWSQTGRDGDPLPMWLTLWNAGDLPVEDLSMGVQGPRPAYADDYLDQVRMEGAPLVRHLGLADARYLLLVPLHGRRVLTAVVPPWGSMSLASPMGPIFAALGKGDEEGPTLLPARPGTPQMGGEEVRWERRREGWHGTRLLNYINGSFFAGRDVALPGTLHLVARGTLALVLDLLAILLLLGVGHLIARGRETPVRDLLRVLGSFRARVTLALFGFFILSIVFFGTLAFQTLSRAAQNAASALAQRIVEDGANFYNDAQGSMQLLSQEVGADLLEYRDGELIGGSADELVALGIYEGWIPEPLLRDMEERREVSATLRSSLGGWHYLLAFRRLPDGDILATPVPVEAGATALRRQEVADLLGFAIVLGAGLSLALALLVGRTLSRPIETLQIASERVGSGNLRVRLPEDRRDEFGSVFGAFNRMVLGIRRARKALLRTSRRTQAIVEEVATGVVALDDDGRVTLLNPRAEALLGHRVVPGQELKEEEGEAGELVRWVDLYFRDGLREASKELQLGDRRIRIRARRVSEEGGIGGGAVLSMEDVTDELRSERILAWGEMARQVAHEVKNPLTPIKLSVQHLQRAWEDRRPDFHQILEKNVGIILQEIDHLAAIARSFSRYGAPEAAGDEPLKAVSISQVAQEVTNLYGGGKGALSFHQEVPPEIPAVRARESELREVLINLLENSRAAIPYQGRVVIGAARDPRGVDLTVTDDGKGIDPELLGRIFEPHFSTRSTGTGLGLAIVRRLVESWGGSIWAESQVGKGTVMHILLNEWKEEG